MERDEEAPDDRANLTPTKRPPRPSSKQDREIAQLEEEARRLREVLRHTKAEKGQAPA